MIKGCCKDCEDRALGCHSNCDKYIKECKERQKINMQKSIDIKLNDMLYGYNKSKKCKTFNSKYRKRG